MDRTGPTPATPTEASDRALLGRARAGDEDAFTTLTAGRLDGSWRVARAILGSDEEAFGAVSTTFAAAWRELPRLGDDDRFDDWLDRILLAECRMRLRARDPGAAAAPPPDLLARTIEAVRASPPGPVRHGASRGRVRSRVPALVAVASVAVAAVVLAAAWPALTGGRDDPRAVTTATAPGTSPVGPDGTPVPQASDAAATTGPVAGSDDGVRVGDLAMVTLGGNNLRVRELPGIGEESHRLKPLLPAGTRMLVVGGPVVADGYTWYEIQTDGELIDLFGWVATGDGTIDWIAPTAARCWGELDSSAVATMSRIDFLACHGDAEVRLQADARTLWDARERRGDCGWVRRRDGCDVDAAWLLMPTSTVKVSLPAGGQRDLVVAMPPDLATALAKLPRQTTLALTVAMDSADATTCRVRDADTGELLIPASQAITACRLQFVVEEVAFRQ